MLYLKYQCKKKGNFMKYISKSESETESIAEALAKKYGPGKTFLLAGDLGAGKTAFTRGLARGYGSDAKVSSPTFTLVHEYDGETKVYHFDLYRLNDSGELYDIGFSDYFSPGTVRVIEWPDNFYSEMPEDSVRVGIKRGDGENDRIIEVFDGEERA